MQKLLQLTSAAPSTPAPTGDAAADAAGSSSAGTPPATETKAVRVLSLKNPAKNAAGQVLGRRKNGQLVRPERNRASAMAVKERVKTWEQKQALRAQREAMKEKQRALNEAMAAERAEERRRLEQKRKQKEENEKKSMVVQKITDTKKIKKMTPKQRRLLMKM